MEGERANPVWPDSNRIVIKCRFKGDARQMNICFLSEPRAKAVSIQSVLSFALWELVDGAAGPQ